MKRGAMGRARSEQGGGGASANPDGTGETMPKDITGMARGMEQRWTKQDRRT